MCSRAPITNLADLPVELLHEVYQLVDQSDALSLRLVCRNICPVASAYAMRELVFFLEG